MDTGKAKVLALGGVGLILVVFALKFVVLKHSSPTTAVTAAPVASAASHADRSANAPVQLNPNLPGPLRTALLRHAVVVAPVYAAGGGEEDALNVLVASEGASDVNAGFAMLNIANESIARQVAQLGVVTDPSVLIVTRPGTIALALDPDAGADAVTEGVLQTLQSLVAQETPGGFLSSIDSVCRSNAPRWTATAKLMKKEQKAKSAFGVGFDFGMMLKLEIEQDNAIESTPYPGKLARTMAPIDALLGRISADANLAVTEAAAKKKAWTAEAAKIGQVTPALRPLLRRAGLGACGSSRAYV